MNFKNTVPLSESSVHKGQERIQAKALIDTEGGKSHLCKKAGQYLPGVHELTSKRHKRILWGHKNILELVYCGGYTGQNRP